MAAWVKALLFLLGGVVAAGGTAYVTGLLDPWLSPGSAVVAPAPEAAAPEPAAPEQEPAAEEAQSDKEPATTAKQDRLVPPSFDLLRVEPDGSVLVAGKAGSKAFVELLGDAAVLGSATAGEEGDFVIVLDDRLAPGDYRLALRATMPGNEAVLSTGTAIVSVPQANDGQVLAMVEEPGAPAQLVTVPQAEPAAPQNEPAPQVVALETNEEPASEVSPAASESAADSSAAPQAAEVEAAAVPDEPEAPVTQQPAATADVVVEAVEIEGDTIFVAGRALPAHTVRVYADALLLGEAVVSDGGRFLVEARRDLAVGNYMIRADLIAKDGSVLARAAVPFEREPGEAIAAVAPAAPATAEATAPQPQTAEEAASQPEAEIGTGPVENGGETATAPALQRADSAVIIRRGDSLWRISRRVYGHGIRYSTIYLANQDQISDPDRIWPGQVFALPYETPEGEQADLDAIADQAVEQQELQPAGE